MKELRYRKEVNTATDADYHRNNISYDRETKGWKQNGVKEIFQIINPIQCKVRFTGLK